LAAVAGCAGWGAEPGAAADVALPLVLGAAGAAVFGPVLVLLLVPALVAGFAPELAPVFALPVLLLLFAPGVADVAFSTPAALVVALAAGVAVVPAVVPAALPVTAGAGAGALSAALAPAACAPDGVASAMLAQPSAHAARRAARVTPVDRVRLISSRGVRVENRVFTTGPSTARYAITAACRVSRARYTQ
jgi:hypothetical protein